MANPIQLSSILIGDSSRHEFRAATRVIHELTTTAEAGSIDAALQRIESDRLEPEFVILAQARPGEFPSDEIARLVRRLPLARIVQLLGSWCEGEVRTGAPWPSAIRAYCYDWVPRFVREVEALREGRCGTWALPCTVSDEDRLLASEILPPDSGHGLIALAIRQPDMADIVAEACTARGYSTARVTRPDGDVRGAAAAVWEGSASAGDVGYLASLKESLNRVPIVALVDFPRAGDCARLAGAGADCVVARPFLWRDFFWRLDRLVARAAVQHGQPPRFAA